MRRPVRSIARLGCWVLAVCCASSSATAAPAPEAGETLRVLSFNVWHGRRRGENNRRFPGEEAERATRRFDWQIEDIRRLEPDLLLLQEVNPNQRQARRYARALGYTEIHKVTSCGLHLGFLLKIPSNVNEGLAILAHPRLGLRRVGWKRLSGNALCTATCGIQTRESRFLLLGRVEVGGRPLLVATTHLSAPAFEPPGFERRLAELVEEGVLEEAQRDEIVAAQTAKKARSLGEVRRLLAEIARRQRSGPAGEQIPVLLGGDFNAEPDSEVVAAIEQAGLDNLATGAGFETWDPVTNATNYEIGSRRADPLPTFGVEQVRELLDTRHETPRQIDHLFASPGWRRVSARRVLDRPRDGIYPSDHFGVLVTLRRFTPGP